MKLNNRMIWMTFSIFIALMFSTLRVSPAYAEGPTPPEEQPTEEGAPPVDETAPIDQILAAVPEDTQVVIVDEDGATVPLASRVAAQAIIEKDPVWCPTGVAPKPNMGGCSPSYPSLSALVAGGTPGGNGTIWIETGNDSGTEVVINGAGNWASAANFSLTLQGGWIGGLTGSKAIVGVSVFDTGISIVNWNGAVTVKDIAMINASNTYDPVTGALNVQTTKNITLANFTATGTTGSTDGAYLSNTSSTTQGAVIVKNSSFNDNGFRGLSIYSDGAITLTNVSANNNAGSKGMHISNSADSIASPITITGGNFNNNFLNGLYITSNGAVKLTNILANFNGGDGVYVDNTFASTAQAVNVIGFYVSELNNGNGLTILSNGKVALANVTSNSNVFKGVSITNSTASTPLGVTLTGSNHFISNSQEGLTIVTRGAVTANNLTVKNNGVSGDKSGVTIGNNFDTSKPQNVTITGVNVFSDNSYHGIVIASYGIVTLNNITAVGNGNGVNDSNGIGVLISDVGAVAKPIILKGTNVFNSNDGSGLHIAALGAITVNNVTASGNGNYGVYIYNKYGTQSPVTLIGYGDFISNTTTGLYIDSNGTISTTNLTASFNGDNGVYIDTIGITAPQAVNIKGNNWFFFNGGAGTESGLVVNSDGKITANNLHADYNYYNGVFLDNFTNWDAPATNFATFGSIVLTGSNSFTNNSQAAGLYVHTHGTVTLNNIHSSDNDNASAGVGVYVVADGNVTLSCIFVSNNHWGLWMGNSVSLLTIRGLYAVGNFTNEHLLYTTINRSGCP